MSELRLRITDNPFSTLGGTSILLTDGSGRILCTEGHSVAVAGGAMKSVSPADFSDDSVAIQALVVGLKHLT